MNIAPISSFLSSVSNVSNLYTDSKIQRKPTETKENSTKNLADTSLQKISSFTVYSPLKEQLIAPVGSLIDYKI